MPFLSKAMDCLFLWNPPSISTRFKVFLLDLVASLYISSRFSEILSILSLILAIIIHFSTVLPLIATMFVAVYTSCRHDVKLDSDNLFTLLKDMQSITFILKELVFVKLHENWKKTTHKSVSSLPKGIAQNNALIMKEFRSFHTTTGPSPETKAHTSLIGNKGLWGSLPTTLNKLQACCCQDVEKMRNTIYLRTIYWSTLTIIKLIKILRHPAHGPASLQLLTHSQR